MPELLKIVFGVMGGILGGYFVAYSLHETLALSILILFSILMVGIFLMFKKEIQQAESRETAQDALVEKLNTSIGAQGESLRANLKQGTEYLSSVARQYNERAQNYHSRHSAYVGLIKYHVYAAAIRQLHQTRNAEKSAKFVKKEMAVLDKIEAGEDVFGLCGDRAHTEEHAYNTLLGRVNNGTLTPKTAFLRCKSCASEFEVCPNCGGELERRFK